jgi:preprotein translocase subunit SecB
MVDNRTMGAGGAPGMTVIAQYVKDLSFESPGAPYTLRTRSGSPNINIGVNLRANPLENEEIEVDLKIDARAIDGETTLFAIELIYSGLFRFSNVPPETVQAAAMMECPRLLFPFARQIICDASRNGGFPPLLIDPIDFVGMYRQRMSEMNPGALNIANPN